MCRTSCCESNLHAYATPFRFIDALRRSNRTLSKSSTTKSFRTGRCWSSIVHHRVTEYRRKSHKSQHLSRIRIILKRKLTPTAPHAVRGTFLLPKTPYLVNRIDLSQSESRKGELSPTPTNQPTSRELNQERKKLKGSRIFRVFSHSFRFNKLSVKTCM